MKNSLNHNAKSSSYFIGSFVMFLEWFLECSFLSKQKRVCRCCTFEILTYFVFFVSHFFKGRWEQTEILPEHYVTCFFMLFMATTVTVVTSIHTHVIVCTITVFIFMHIETNKVQKYRKYFSNLKIKLDWTLNMLLFWSYYSILETKVN